MCVHSELPRRPAPTDAALHRVKARNRALTLQHLQAVIMHSNAIFLSAIPQLRHTRTCRRPPGAVNMIPVLVTSRAHYRMQVKTSGSKHTSVSTDGYLATLNQHRYICSHVGRTANAHTKLHWRLWAGFMPCAPLSCAKQGCV